MARSIGDPNRFGNHKAVPTRQRATLRDVARAAGVSKTVASRGLAGYADVAPATRERVRQVARNLGYRASVRARRLTAGKDAPARCAVVSLRLSSAQMAHSFFGPVLTGVMAAAAPQGIEVQLTALTDLAAGVPAALEQLAAEDGADGVVLLTWLPLTPADVAPLADHGIPFVLANRHFGAQPVSCVTLDWVSATRDAVVRLAALGHRRLALLLPTRDTSTMRDHARGWTEGRAACGLSPAAAPILYSQEIDGPGAAEWIAALLRQGLPKPSSDSPPDPAHPLTGQSAGPPTAVVCYNDWCALAVLRAAAALGIRVPQQLSVIGFDDLIAAATTPPLCSYDPHLHELGVRAVSLLGQLLRGDVTTPRREQIPLTFKCRGSCGPAP